MTGISGKKCLGDNISSSHKISNSLTVFSFKAKCFLFFFLSEFSKAHYMGVLFAVKRERKAASDS